MNIHNRLYDQLDDPAPEAVEHIFAEMSKLVDLGVRLDIILEAHKVFIIMNHITHDVITPRLNHALKHL
jgi:hypothetical protein